ncbi:MAG: PhzF family phenazine biosynthesis protein [Nocardioidaceae bacterium]|nr:PhzF family phenazine biosynthesis protein [Nocardioidaceae bacterium]
MPTASVTGVMRAIAREFNQSETTIILSPTQEGAQWHLRSFTASGAEVGGAGHNALGAWWWLAVSGRLDLDKGSGRFMQEISDLILPVEVVGEHGKPRAIAMAGSLSAANGRPI